MSFHISQMELDEFDIGTLHDIMFQALKKETITDEEIIKCWNDLPFDIKCDVIKYGISDTPTKDAIYSWIKKVV